MNITEISREIFDSAHSTVYSLCGLDITVGYTEKYIVSVSAWEGGSHMSGEPSALSDGAARQLEEYLCGKRMNFELPVAIYGTDFQKAVLRELALVPFGETRSYGYIAEQIGRPRAFRAVGMACHRNPVGIIIPCHRIVGSSGALTGYAGGLGLKERLLRLERRTAAGESETCDFAF